MNIIIITIFTVYNIIMKKHGKLWNKKCGNVPNCIRQSEKMTIKMLEISRKDIQIGLTKEKMEKRGRKRQKKSLSS